jgi:hypothetical protein
MVEFGLERDRTEVEEDRTRVGDFWFISIRLVALNWSWHPVFIGWGCLSLAELIKSIFGSSNQIRSVWISLTGRLNRSDRCECVQKSENIQIAQLFHLEYNLSK